MDRKVFITGGTGTLGTALTRAFLAAEYQVTVFSRNPHRQAKFRELYPQVNTYLGDIRDKDLLLRAMSGSDIVIHAAALKRVDTGEYDRQEYHSVNVIGTDVVARAVADCGPRIAIMISSDKAVAPLNFYGKTKALAEGLWLAYGRNYGTIYSAVRYGNVMGSNGSVIPYWKAQVERGDSILVRVPEPTRFCMLPIDAVNLVMYAIDYATGGDIFIHSGRGAFSIHELARYYQPEATWLTQELGLGEKQHEALVAPGECIEVVDAVNGIYRVNAWQSGPFVVDPLFISNTAPRLTAQEVIDLVEQQHKEPVLA